MNATTSVDCPKCRRWVPAELGAHPDGECPPPPETATLPVTGLVVPAAAARWTVKPIGSMRTADGEAFRAEVYADGDCIGTIENEGRGGGTWFRPAHAAARIAFDAMVEEYAAISEDNRWVPHESLCNDLYEEVALARELNRKRNAVVMLDGDRDQIMVFNSKADDRLRAHLREKYGERASLWIKGSGWLHPITLDEAETLLAAGGSK